MRYSVLIALLLLPVLLFGQDKPLPPPRDFKPETKDTKDVLPALLLPEYIITGSDLISFTEDRKGAMTEPDSRAFTARAGRGMREQHFLDTSPTRMPLGKAALPGSDHVLLTRAGFGSFSTPQVHILYGDRYALGDASAALQYERSNGHVPRSDYSRFRFGANGGTYLPRDVAPLLASSRLQGGLSADVHSYGLYADKLERVTPAPDFRRNVQGLGADVELLSRRNRVIDHTLRLFFGHTFVEEEFLLLDTMRIDEYSIAETRIGLDASAWFDYRSFPLRTNLLFRVNDLSERDENSSRPFHIRADAETQYAIGEATMLSGGLATWVFRGSDHASQFRLYPQLRLQHRLTDDWALEAAFSPTVQEQTFAGLLEQNPYLMLASEIRQTDIPVRIEAAASFDDRAATAGRVRLRWSSSPSWPRFSLLPDPVRQQWEMHYNGWASITELSGEFVHNFSDQTRIQTDALFRISSNDELDGSIPYLPDYEWRVLLGHRFPFDLLVESTLQLIGDRASTQGSLLTGWMLLGFELEYRVFRSAAVFLRVDNLLDQTYQVWDGYRARPFFVLGGLIIRI
ncbi:MAG: hypothetical protein JXA28_10235 [Bacteroidetes bacterium]|nr:hypothetical protein [Bacteroidota bacterium]